MIKDSCPICGSVEISYTHSFAVPVLQNRVFENANEAKTSPVGYINIAFCNQCCFVFNSEFNNEIIIYDANYDNSVPSKIFNQYYDSIAHYLYNSYDLTKGVLYDIGCGKGIFLKRICALYPDIKAIGIDPSYEGELNVSENLSFIQDFFKVEYAKEKPSIAICRHVFEHIEYPVQFLKEISKGFKEHNDVPLFLEVPDIDWIIKNKSFWDICYEHCNYFNPFSLHKMLELGNSSLNKITPAFKDQYIWAESILNGTKPIAKDIYETSPIKKDDIVDFIINFSILFDKSKSIIEKYKNLGYKIAVWGMATKGVEFCNIIDAKNEIIDYCIDINVHKQDKYIPFTSHKIVNHKVLENEKNSLLVIVMNPNYLNEIKSTVLDYGLNTQFIDGHGSSL